MLKLNSWEHLAAEVLISTPRRFGKTISVSMFAAAILFAAPAVELSIYSTCKRISQKLLRNVVKFFHIICNQDLPSEGFKVLRQNMEEIVLQGAGGSQDVRVVNSYPSKVTICEIVCYMCWNALCVWMLSVCFNALYALFCFFIGLNLLRRNIPHFSIDIHD